MAIYQRISARRGNTVQLDMRFMHGGVATAPYAIRKVDIYKTQILPSNLVASFICVDPCDPNYPSPIEYVRTNTECGPCGTEGEIGVIVPGEYRLLLDIPADAAVPDIYFDVWTYLPNNPCLLQEWGGSALECVTDTAGCVQPADMNSPEIAGMLLQACSKFWCYSDDWDTQDGLLAIRLGFEPIDQKFNQPELRPLEIGIMPLPLYDYDFNLVAPVLPQLTGTITISTGNNEVLVEQYPLTLGLRQGSYRSNPYVFRYMVDTTKFLKGTYQYSVTAILPDGTTRTSKQFILTIS
jgi:hypothetical protein